MNIKILLILFIALPGSLPAGDVKTILIVGDSLSAAHGMPVDRGWVALLQHRIDTARLPFAVVNASISGDTTAGGRARLPQALAQYQPAIVILELGGNDGLRGLALEAMKQNLAAMIESTLKSGALVLLIGVELPPNYGPLYTERFRAVYRDLAAELNVALLPSMVRGVGTEPELMQDDGIHPKREAQPLIVARVWEHLEPLLGSAPGHRVMPP